MTGLLISSIAFKPYPYSEYRLYIIFLNQSPSSLWGKLLLITVKIPPHYLLKFDALFYR
jgi:hypothetical protein